VEEMNSKKDAVSIGLGLEEPKATACPECYLTIPAFSSDAQTGPDGKRRHANCHRQAKKRITTCPECSLTISPFSTDVKIGFDGQRRHNACHRQAEAAGKLNPRSRHRPKKTLARI